MMVITKSFLRVSLVLWSLLFHAAFAQQSSSRKDYGDGSYCVRCTTPAVADDASIDSAILCGVGAIIANGCFAPIIQDQCGDPTRVDARFNLAKGWACASAGSCLTGCNQINDTSFVMDWCCFKSGSPFIDTYISDVSSTPPLVKTKSKGVDCDVIDTIAKSYEIAKANGPNSLGYYGQLVNIVCLRSACPNAACDRVKKLEIPDDCDLPDEMPFEQDIFGRIAREASDPKDIAAKSARAHALGEDVSNSFTIDTISSLSNIPRFYYGFGQASSWGTLFAGYGHFMENLGPYFSDYIKNLVATTPDDASLTQKIASLANEHETFIRCAVTPGFDLEGSLGEIPYLPSKLAGSILVPTAAREFRNYYLWYWLLASGRVSKPEDLAKFGIKVSPPEELLYDPSAARIQKLVEDGLMLWRKEEEEGIARYSAKDSNIAVLAFSSKDVEVNVGSFSLKIRAREEYLRPQMAYVALVNLTDSPTAQFPFNTSSAEKIQIVGEMACIYPASATISLINTTHVIPRNISLDPIPVEKYLTDLSSSINSKPQISLEADKDVLFRQAEISFSLPAGTQIQSNDVTIFDLLSGKPFEDVISAPSSTSGSKNGKLTANVKPGKGSWGYGWNGGGCFALGLKDPTKNLNPANVTSSVINTPSVSTVSITLPVTTPPSSTTRNPNVGEIINSVLDGPPATNSPASTPIFPSPSISTPTFAFTEFKNSSSTVTGTGKSTAIATGGLPVGNRTSSAGKPSASVATFSSSASSFMRVEGMMGYRNLLLSLLVVGGGALGAGVFVL